MARRAGRPTAVGDTLKRVLEKSGLAGLSASSELASRWANLVGPGIAAHSSPGAVKGGRLTVTVDSSAWMNQLSLLSGEIISRVNAGLPGAGVTELRFRIGRPEKPRDTRAKKQPGNRPARRKLTDAELEDIERAAAAIADPELSARARKLLTAAASTRKKA